MHPKHIVFDGQTYRLSGNYYRRNKWGTKGPSNLHRAIWEASNGPIPEGYEVHHKDGDTFNNVISNLECVPMNEHQREHMLERHAAGLMGAPSAAALERAAEWHKSAEGVDWHKKHGSTTIKKMWESKEWGKCICQMCGIEFRSAFPTRAKFCHPNCRAMALRQRRGLPVNVKPGLQKPRTMEGKRAATDE